MANLAGSGVAAYGELNELTHATVTGTTVTELLIYCRPEWDCYYPWLEDYLAWLEGKEIHRGYHEWLEQTAPWWDGSLEAAESCEISSTHKPVGCDGSG